MKAVCIIVAVVAAVLGGCAPTPAKSPEGATRIRFATDWTAEAELGGYYEALADGEYVRRGLAVSIVPGGPGVNVPQLVASGAVDMGVGSNSFVVMNLAAEHVPVKAVAAFMQKDPQVLIAHPDAAIASLADLKGHPILLADASISAFWPWLKAKYGLSDNQVRKYNFNNAPFLADKRVVEQGYVTSEPYTLETQGHIKPRVFLLADDGYPSYGGMVLAPDRLIASNPAAVRAFVDATAAGWKAYLWGDPRPADALILKDNREMTEDILAHARATMRAYGIVDSGDATSLGLGAMTDVRWQGFCAMAKAQRLYPAGVDCRAAYTLAFLPTMVK